MIDLTELENLNSTTVDDNGAPVPASSSSARKTSAADETFSTLALRTPTSVGDSICRTFDQTGATAFGSLDDSGEFAVPHGTDATE